MQHYHSLESVTLQDVWLTIGSFDGVHLGHRAIIHRLVAGAHAAGDPAVVLTFHPHPAVVLGKRRGLFYLTSPDDRARQLAQLGVDVVITHPFNDQVRQLSAREFIEKLDRRLGFKKLLVGYDFALGRGRQGDISALQELGKSFGYHLDIVEPFSLNGKVVSSSQIRTALMEGQVARAANLLGRPYTISGRVIHGDGRGRQLGIPTANLDIWSEQLVPKPGVYACRAGLDGQIWAAVTNIGVRPTFEDTDHQTRVETHLLDFNSDLYDREMSLYFIEHLRDEKRFSDVQSLVEQIQNDILRARTILSESQ